MLAAATQTTDDARRGGPVASPPRLCAARSSHARRAPLRPQSLTSHTLGTLPSAAARPRATSGARGARLSPGRPLCRLLERGHRALQARDLVAAACSPAAYIPDATVHGATRSRDARRGAPGARCPSARRQGARVPAAVVLSGLSSARFVLSDVVELIAASKYRVVRRTVFPKTENYEARAPKPFASRDHGRHPARRGASHPRSPPARVA